MVIGLFHHDLALVHGQTAWVVQRHRRIRRQFDAHSRIHDVPRTPLERLQASAQADSKIVAKLIALHERIDPSELARTITDKLEALEAAANRRKDNKTG